jgi:hypothetical protein
MASALDELGKFTPEQRDAYRLFQHRDFWFMTAYGLTLLAANYQALSPKRFLLVVPVFAAGFDFFEDHMILAWLNGTRSLESALDIVWWLGIGKFTFFAIAILVPVLLTAHRFMNSTRTVYENEMRVERTYFSLRLALTTLMTVLLVALGFHAACTSCIRQSISAYYYTPLQVTFVGTLIAVGTCLIVYQGTTYIENVLLDIAGFLAFIVALVPTTPTDTSCQESIVQSGVNPADLVRYNVAPLLGVTIAATTWTLWRRYQDRNPVGREPELNRIRAGLVAQIVIVGAVWAIPDGFKSVAHWIAASGLFVCVIAVVWSNHLERKESTTRKSWWAKNVYAVVIAFMGLVLAVTAVMLVADWAYRVTFVEFGLILGFVVFWGIQTADLKSYANRAEKADAEQ